MRSILILFGLCVAALAHAQTASYPPPNASSFAKQSDLTALQSTIMSAMPQLASTAPMMENVAGSAGSASTYRRGDAVQPRITRSGSVTIGAAGTATFDWTAQGAIATPVQVVLSPVYSGAATPSCWPTAVTATSASIRCRMGSTVSLTLSALTAASLAGLTLDPFTGSANGLVVGVIALPSS